MATHIHGAPRENGVEEEALSFLLSSCLGPTPPPLHLSWHNKYYALPCHCPYSFFSLYGRYTLVLVSLNSLVKWGKSSVISYHSTEKMCDILSLYSFMMHPVSMHISHPQVKMDYLFSYKKVTVWCTKWRKPCLCKPLLDLLTMFVGKRTTAGAQRGFWCEAWLNRRVT
jgi:hypothetical protein